MEDRNGQNEQTGAQQAAAQGQMTDAQQTAAPSDPAQAAGAQQTAASGNPVQNTAPQGNAEETEQARKTRRNMERITSPEQVDDYIRVTTPGMWLLAIAMIILLAAGVIWGFAGRIEMKTVDKNGQQTTEYVAPSSFLTDGTAS